MSMLNKARAAKKAISRAVFSKTVIAYLLFAVALAMTVVYSLWDVVWDPARINWGRLWWSLGLIVGLFSIGMFIGWMLESQNIRDDESSDFCLARRDFREERSKIAPKSQYFSQFHVWERANEINEMKCVELIDAGWRSTDSSVSEDEVVNATAHDIAFYASEGDVRAAMATETAILVDRAKGHEFCISRISQKLGEETIKILSKKEKIEFCEASYYLTDTEYDPKDSHPQLANGYYLSKKNSGKALGGAMSSIALMVAWSILIGGATMDQYYGSSGGAWVNTISRIGSLVAGVLRGFSIVDAFYLGMADVLRDKIGVLEKFYNCVMVDGNFIPDARTPTAKDVYEKARARQKALEDERAEKRRSDDAEAEAARKREEAYEAEEATRMAEEANRSVNETDRPKEAPKEGAKIDVSEILR